MTVRVMNPRKIIYETAQGICAVLPVVGEQLSVKDFHQPMVAALGGGMMFVEHAESSSSATAEFLISGGLAAMSHDNVLTVFVEGGQAERGG